MAAACERMLATRAMMPLSLLKLVPFTVLVAGTLLASTAQADAMRSFVQQSNCMSCHHASVRVLGPSFNSIRERYQDEPGAAAGLAKSINWGSVGKWGATPMPANRQITENEALAAARWILSPDRK